MMLTFGCRLWDYCMHEKERKKEIQKQRHGKVQKDEIEESMTLSGNQQKQYYTTAVSLK